ncbi:MAG: S8 family peptidase [Candidatus Thorarchaeota archaeon]
MEHTGEEISRKRGTAILVITLIIIAGTVTVVFLPRAFGFADLTVKVAVVDSGVDKDNLLFSRVIAEKSFVNSSYGYRTLDESVVDSKPNNEQHGTHIAKIIAENALNAAIINAKVVDANNTATERGIIEAVRWAILEEDCDIINLSLGGTPSNVDGLRELVAWAFDMGVSIISAAGNNGQDGITGSSVESPAVYLEVIAVGAVDDSGVPYYFTGRGPLRGRTLKPDISATGYYTNGVGTFFGTSFATPRVSAAAANIIRFCQDNLWDWTPGMIKSTLLASAKPSSYEPWEVGAGLLDEKTAFRLLESVDKINNLPMMVWMSPFLGAYDFERWFVNTSIEIDVAVFASTNTSFQIAISGSAAEWIVGPEAIAINQTGSFPITIQVIASGRMFGLTAQVSLISSFYRYIFTEFNFDVSIPIARVAFDFSHTPWWIDSIYGQFRAFYERISDLGIAVVELNERSEIELENMKRFDAVIILDPCAWEFNMSGYIGEPIESISYTKLEIDAYYNYWDNGGNIFFVGGNNISIDIEGANSLLSRFNVSLNNDKIPGITFFVNGLPNTEVITKIAEHPITDRVEKFDYNGCSLNFTGSHVELAWVLYNWLDDDGVSHQENRTVLTALEGSHGARLIVTGSNFFLDNWGINGIYAGEDDSLLMLQSVFWLLGVL